MKTLPFLLEIGTEEIPDWMIQPALKHLGELFEGLLKDHKLDGKVSMLEATPRRLVLMAEGLPRRQPSSVELVTGPPKSAGESAAAGFARKLGVEPAALKTVRTPKGEYLAFKKKVQGRATLDILAAELPGLILKIYFPKTMYWTGKGGPRFIRPIRWIVALLGSRVVSFELAGVKSGNVTRGHRQLGKQKIRVTIGNYSSLLRSNFVMLPAWERRLTIQSQADYLFEARGVYVRPDAALLDTLTYLTEYPATLVGGFDEQFLNLPEEVLVTVMRHHQRYFSVYHPDETLAPYFMAVMNAPDDPEGLVRQGHERVLRARFNDASFFWNVDQQKRLDGRLPDLAHVTWQAQLGSYREKTDRVVALVKELGGSAHAQRAALLSKCDLTTGMVKEFTELQGVMGGLYARAQGEPEPVWRAVYEHYRPASMEDKIPSTREGCLVSLADRLDTLRGCFGIGLTPSGSKDPFGLRRAAQGVVKILVEGKLPLPLSKLLGENAELREFLLDRVRYYFRDVRGFKYDEVNAILAAGWDDLADVESRLAAIQAVRPTEHFEPLAASFKRIRNILRQAEFAEAGEVSEQLIEEGPERELYNAFRETSGRVRSGDLDYREKLAAIAGMRPVVDRFFDKVLVNAPDGSVRRNRLSLLGRLLAEFSVIADFSEIVTEGT
ncbi:MAG: glycine--tRNA ligase subunit beta [Bryobacterales bacterium]|nr:glycine--tRNA ligase subunit beta [Bryobacterales bacterium]